MNRWFILGASLSCWLASSAVAYGLALKDGAVVTFTTKSSRQCIGVDRASKEIGARGRIGRFDCDNHPNQRWRVERQGDGYRFVNENRSVNEKSKKCIGVDGASTKVGADIAQFECDGKANQTWKLIGDPNLVRLQNAKSNHCLGVDQAVLMAKQFECNKGSRVIQEWRVVVR
jgi:galactose oxidase